MTDAREPQTTADRLARMRQTHKEIVESDGGECELMADYRWACDEIEHLRAELEGWRNNRIFDQRDAYFEGREDAK